MIDAPCLTWNANDCPRLGVVPFTVLTTLARPRFVFVKVQTTVSPAERLIAVTELPSLQLEVLSQPEVAASLTEYVP